MAKKATRPCPCGYLGHPSDRCRCTPDRVIRYRQKISGPLLDRIDLQIEVAGLGTEAMRNDAEGESSARMRDRVTLARERQLVRQAKPNALLSTRDIETHCRCDAACDALLRQAIARMNLSARAYHRVLKVARTIADLSGNDAITPTHVAEAIGYRRGFEKA